MSSDSDVSENDDEYLPDESDLDMSSSEISNESEDDFLLAEEPRELDGGWSRITHAFDDSRSQPLPPLVRNYADVNPAVGFTDTMSALECFEHFITADVLNYIITCVNDRANDFFEKHPEKKGVVNRILWKDIAKHDLCTFLALYYYTGICKFPDMNMYWCRKPMEPGVHFYTSSIMSRDRYLSIMKFLRFSKVSEVRKDAPSTRLNSFCKLLTDISKNRVDAGEHIAIDEALVLWKGRLGFRQFIRTKRARFGIKLFVMCNAEAKWSGYNYDFRIYYGKDNLNPLTLPDIEGVAELTKSEQIVVHLITHLFGQGHHIVVDNWYASVRLAHFLDSQKTLMTATMRTNRGVPQELVSKRLERSTAAFIRKDNTLIVKWEDKKSVYVISTKYTAGFVEKDRTFYGGARTNFKKPTSVEKYNTYMGGVDKADQYLEPLDPSRKSLAWFKKLGLHIIMRMMLNSFIVYKNSVQKKAIFKNYIITISEALLTKYNPEATTTFDKYIVSNPRAGRKRPIEKVIHAWVQLEQLPGSSTKKPRKRCRVCHPNRVLCCSGCDEKPALSSMEHFREWHNSNS